MPNKPTDVDRRLAEEIARQFDDTLFSWPVTADRIAQALTDARAAEREACANIAYEHCRSHYSCNCRVDVQRALRKRGE